MTIIYSGNTRPAVLFAPLSHHLMFALQWEIMSEMKNLADRQAACDELFKSEEDEYRLYEAVKFLMLNTAIKLFEDNEKGKAVPVFAWLLFARDTSSNPSQLLENHLNPLGHTGGLEQVSLILHVQYIMYIRN